MCLCERGSSHVFLVFPPETSHRKDRSPVDNQLLIIIGASAGALILVLVIVVLLVNRYHRHKNKKLEMELSEKTYADIFLKKKQHVVRN